MNNIRYPENVPPLQLEVLKQLCRYFLTLPVHGMYANGSIATGMMDENSDLDLTVTFDNPALLYECWRNRNSWPLEGVIHRFDADHRKNNFVVLIFENGIKADVYLTMPGSIYPVEKPPFIVLYDPSGFLKKELNYVWSQFNPSTEELDWCVKEDERFWGWMQFEYNHFKRGNFLLLADDFFVFRKILESWLGLWVEGRKLTTREFCGHPELNEWRLFFENDLFPGANKDEQYKAHQLLIRYALTIRQLLADKYQVRWNTSERMLKHICSLFDVNL
jgi:hypothetical protein